MGTRSDTVANRHRSRRAVARKVEMPDEPLETAGEWYRAIFNEVSDGIALIDSATGRIYDCNPEFARLTGRSLKQLKKMRIWELRPPDKREAARKKFCEIRSKGKGGSTELDFQKPDGEIVAVEFKAKAIEFRGKNYIQSIVRDITDRKKAEEALRESESRLRSMIESVSDGIAVTDLEGTITDLNEQGLRMYGGDTRDELLGRNSVELIAPQEHERAIFNMQKVLTQGNMSVIEHTLIRSDGSEYPGELNASVIQDSTGNPVGFIAVIRDISDRKKAEEALKSTEVFYRALIENSLDGIAILNADGSIRYQSASFKNLLGYEPQEEIGNDIYNRLHPEDIPQVADLFMKIIQNEGGHIYHVVRARHKDGSWHYIEAEGHNLLNDPAVNGIVVNFRDITERKWAEDELRKSEERYRLLAENATDIIWTMDLDLKYTYVSPSVERVRGYSVEEVMSQGIQASVAPQSLELALNVYAEELAIEEMETKDITRSRTMELELNCKDGSTIWTEVKISSLRDQDGRPLGLLGITRDITERKQAEAALRESEERYREVVERAYDGIGILQDGITIFANSRCAAIVGFTPAELIGTLMTNNIHPDQLPTLVRNYKQRIAGEPIDSTYEIRLLHKNGSTVYVEASMGLIAHQGRPAVLVVARDITERKRMEQQLQLAGRLAAVGELAAGVAHELNNPLAAVQAYAELLSSRDDLDETAKADVQTIYEQAQRATSITGNLLSFARQHRPEKGLLSINEIIRKSLELHAYSMTANNIEVITELEPDLPDTMADFHQLQQVFVNLITNAEQAMIEANGGGTLIIKTQKVDHMIQITFNDNGPGIPDGSIKSLFDPFFTTKDVGKGTGLGLSICYGIVREHGGYMYARSKSGEGATFVVEIPVIPENVAVVDMIGPDAAIQHPQYPT